MTKYITIFLNYVFCRYSSIKYNTSLSMGFVQSFIIPRPSNQRTLITQKCEPFMASRFTHINVGLLSYALTLVVLYFLKVPFDIRKDPVWFILGFLLTLYGAEFPDIDQLYKKIFNHRDWLTHSSILPTILFILALISKENSLYPLLAFFCLGVSSHLIMDYFPTWKDDGDKKFEPRDIEYALKWVEQGVTGKELVQQLVGTYLIHLPLRVPKEIKGDLSGRKTLTVVGTRLYLYVNALLLLGYAVFLFYRFYY